MCRFHHTQHSITIQRRHTWMKGKTNQTNPHRNIFNWFIFNDAWHVALRKQRDITVSRIKEAEGKAFSPAMCWSRQKGCPTWAAVCSQISAFLSKVCPLHCPQAFACGGITEILNTQGHKMTLVVHQRCINETDKLIFKYFKWLHPSSQDIQKHTHVNFRWEV